MKNIIPSTILIDATWGDKPTKENFIKHGIIKLKCVDAGIYKRNYHTYTYKNKLYCGFGYAWSCTFNPSKDNIMIEDITGMSHEDLKSIYPKYIYPK
jgi:hypothetical protein